MHIMDIKSHSFNFPIRHTFSMTSVEEFIGVKRKE